MIWINNQIRIVAASLPETRSVHKYERIVCSVAFSTWQDFIVYSACSLSAMCSKKPSLYSRNTPYLTPGLWMDFNAEFYYVMLHMPVGNIFKSLCLLVRMLPEAVCIILCFSHTQWQQTDDSDSDSDRMVLPGQLWENNIGFEEEKRRRGFLKFTWL